MNDNVTPVGAAKIAITSTGDSLESNVDPRFGRCAYFAIVDRDGNMEAVPNTARELSNGAGIQAAKQMIDMKVQAVVTGNVGPNAFRVLSAGGVKVFVGGLGTVRETLERYSQGALTETSASNAPGHHGMGGERWGQRR